MSPPAKPVDLDSLIVTNPSLDRERIRELQSFVGQLKDAGVYPAPEYKLEPALGVIRDTAALDQRPTRSSRPTQP